MTPSMAHLGAIRAVLSIAVWCGCRLARLSLFGCAAAALSTCAPGRPPATLHDLAEAYVRITLQFAQHRPQLVDAWTGSSAWRPGPRVPVADLSSQLDGITKRTEAIQPRDLDATEALRLTYLRGQLRALSLVARRLSGEATAFEEEVRGGLGASLPHVDAAQLAQARAALDRELPGTTALADRYAAFRRTFLIPPGRVDRAISASVEACRTATAPYITLPPDERIDVEFDGSVQWDASAHYTGRHRTLLRVASREGHDAAALLHMACHETYAGHHLQHVLLDDALVKGRGWVEFQLSPAFGPHLLISEGAAEAGVDLALPEQTRAAIYRDRLLPLAGLAAAEAERLARVETLAMTIEASIPPIIGRYLDNQASTDTTIKALQSEALMPTPVRFLAFAERHRAAAVGYPLGRAVVGGWIARAATEEERWRRLQDLFTLRPFTIN